MSARGGAALLTQKRAAARKAAADKRIKEKAAKSKGNPEDSYDEDEDGGSQGSDEVEEEVQVEKPTKKRGKTATPRKSPTKKKSRTKTDEEIYLDVDPFPMTDYLKKAEEAFDMDAAKLAPMWRPSDDEEAKAKKVYTILYEGNLDLPQSSLSSSFFQTKRLYKVKNPHKAAKVEMRETRAKLFLLGWNTITSRVFSNTQTLVCKGMNYDIRARIDPWKTSLPPEHSAVLASLFPPQIDVMEAAFVNLDSPHRVPNKAQINSAIDDELYSKMRDHFLFTSLIARGLEMGEEPRLCAATSLRRSPSLFAKMATIAIFAMFHKENLDVVLARAMAIATGKSTFGRSPLLFAIRLLF